MSSLRGSKSSAIGLFVDGHDVKLAKLSVRKSKMFIDELQTAILASKLEERQAVAVELDAISESAETFALAPSDAASDVSGASNNDILLALLSKYPTSQYVLGYSISEPSIYYHTLESDFGLKGKKLKQRVLDELRTVRAAQPAIDAIDFFYTIEKNLVCVIREDGTSLLHSLEEIKPFLGKRLPKIALIDVADIALMNLARANYGFNPDEITALIYVGAEFTRLIFMRGSEFFHFAPVLGEGFDSPNIQNTIYSRLLLEQDNMGIPRIDRVLLAGECRRIGFDEFIRQQLAEVNVQYLQTPQIDTSALPAEMQEQIPEYAVAIATAWKILDDDHPAFYPVNLLPEAVREGQRSLKLGWHGYLLLALIFLSTLFFTSRYAQLKQEIVTKKSTLVQLQDKEKENEKMKAAITDLSDQVDRYNKALAIYDSLVPGTERWNRLVAQLTKGIDDLGGAWVTEVRALPGGAMSVQGYALYRARIPRIASIFENATLTKVEVKEIRTNTPSAYNFIISVPPQPEKNTSSSMPVAATTDSSRTNHSGTE